MSSLAALIIGAVLVFLALLFLPFYFFLIRPASRRKKVLETGLPGTALVKEVQDTGVTINQRIQVRLRLEVRPSDLSPAFEASAMALVPRLDPGLYRQGVEVRVKYDPETRIVAVDA